MKRLKVYEVNEYDQLKPNQKAWIDHYIACGFNMTQATNLAGYKGNPTQQRRIGSENAIKFDKLIAERTKAVDKKRTKELKDIFEFWSNVIDDNDERLENRIKCSELLAKAKGGFIERVMTTTVDETHEAFKDLSTDELKALAKGVKKK